MANFTLLIASLGALIKAIACFLRDEGIAAAKIAGTASLNASASAAGWLAGKLELASKRVAAKRVLSTAQ